jgi:hypothetical protein
MVGSVSQICMTYGMQREKSATATAMRMSDVLFGFIWQALFTSEIVSVLSIVGALLVMSSIIVVVVAKQYRQGMEAKSEGNADRSSLKGADVSVEVDLTFSFEDIEVQPDDSVTKEGDGISRKGLMRVRSNGRSSENKSFELSSQISGSSTISADSSPSIRSFLALNESISNISGISKYVFDRSNHDKDFQRLLGDDTNIELESCNMSPWHKNDTLNYKSKKTIEIRTLNPSSAGAVIFKSPVVQCGNDSIHYSNVASEDYSEDGF